MATKALQARIINADTRVRAALGRTHRVFNICLAHMIERYIDMRKGKYGDECQQLMAVILDRSNTFAHGVMDKLTRPEITTELDEGWIELAKHIIETQGPLFLQHEGFADVDGRKIHTKGHGKHVPTPDRLAVTAKFWHQVCDDASAFLKSYFALLDDWRSARKQWLQEREKWMEEHADFMRFWEGPYAAFEKDVEEARLAAQNAAGQKETRRKGIKRTQGKRIARWHLWYDWVIRHPETVEWRGQASASDFRPVPDDVRNEVQKKHSRQDKQVSKFLDWIQDNNPELKELDRQRRKYLRDFHHFRRPPTLTLPSPDKHPDWFQMERDVFYRNTDFEKGTIQLQLIDEDSDGIWLLRWFDVQMKCDPRLIPSYREKVYQAEGRFPPYIDGKPGRTLNRPPGNGDERKAGVAGAKLILKNDSHRLVFTIIDQNMPRKISRKKVSGRTCSADNVFDGNGDRVPIRVLTVDLGIRHIGGFAVAEGTREDDGWSVSWLKKGILGGKQIPNLYNIRGHDRQLKKRRRQRGKPVSGEESLVDFQFHRTKMAEDRFKKGAHAIIEMARNWDVHMILFEELSSLSFRAQSERWVNRQLRDMNRRRIVEMVEQQAEEWGIVCDDRLNPYLTSHICSRCLLPGTRFSFKRKDPYREQKPRKHCHDHGYPIWDIGGHLFRCPHCGYKVNADINAAGNLANKFFGLWTTRFKREKWVYTWKEDDETRTFDARKVFDDWINTIYASSGD